MGVGKKERNTAELELQWKPRRWSEHWFSCFGDCTGAGWLGCCLAYWLPCVAFGCNSHKVLRNSLWLEALKYVLILSLAALAYRAASVTEFITCGLAAGEAMQAAGDSQPEQEKAAEALVECKFKFFFIKFLLSVVLLVMAVCWAVFVGGPRRRQLREALGIPVTDPRGACCTWSHSEENYCNSDCCLHYWCTCCALAQETRTVLQVEREQRAERLAMPDDYVPLISAPSAGGDMERHAGEKLLPV